MRKTTVTFRAPESVARRLDALSAAAGVDRSAMLRRLIVEASPEAVGRRELPDRDELLDLLGEAARSGNVSAIKTLMERVAVDDEPDPFAELDAAAEFRGLAGPREKHGRRPSRV
jgi:predicted transcriptional regulator